MPFNISPAHLALTGQILFLVTRPELMAAQLAGADLSLAEAGTLQGDVSTDEITPVAILSHYDCKLARYPYTGLKLGEQRSDRAGCHSQGHRPAPADHAQNQGRLRRRQGVRVLRLRSGATGGG